MQRSSTYFHLAFWLAYLLFKVYHEFVWLLASYQEVDWPISLRLAFWAQLSMLPAKVAFTYWLLRKVLPGFAKPGFATDGQWQNWSKLISGLLVTVLVYRLGIVHVSLPLVYGQTLPESQPLFSWGSWSSALVDIGLVAGLAAALSLYRKQRLAAQREMALEKEKLAAELLFLKQQTNPHFLFNTLNNLYGLARKESPRTADALLQLSKMMRFMLHQASQPLIPLAEEIALITDYLALEKLRYGHRLNLRFELDTDTESKFIAPLLLLPLVENAFKHGASESTEKAYIDISLRCTENSLAFEVRNTMELPVTAKTGGIGLANIKRQLALLYPRHRFSAGPDGNLFVAHLSLNLDDYEAIPLPDRRR